MHAWRKLQSLDAFHVAVCLAAAWSVVAGAVTFVLGSLTTLSEPALVLGVMLFGFVSSWFVTDHAGAATPARRPLS